MENNFSAFALATVQQTLQESPSDGPPADQPPVGRQVRLPPEVISLIVAYLVPKGPAMFPSPDPWLHLLPAQPPTFLAPRLGPTPKETARAELRALCTGLGHEWGDEARRKLWADVEIGMPRAWESLLRVVEAYGGAKVAPLLVRGASLRWKSREAELEAGTSSISLEEDRGRSLLPDWSATDVNWSAMSSPTSSLIIAPLSPPSSVSPHMSITLCNPAHSPLLLTRSISFARFRTAGMSRSGQQGSHERFVTPGRLLALLQATRASTSELGRPGYATLADDEEEDYSQKGVLEAVGFTEFMDSAISKKVLEELLFRGGYEADYSVLADPHETGAKLLAAEGIESALDTRRPSASPAGFRVSPARRRLSSPSTSRSPFRASSLSQASRIEEDTEDEGASGSERDHKRAAASDKPRLAPITTRVARTELTRRSSGSSYNRVAFSSSPSRARGGVELLDSDEDDVARGRDRTTPRRGFNRSVAPPSALYNDWRSTSVPAPLLAEQAVPMERSSSVPAAPPSIERTVVRAKEGSRNVTPIKALDLCGVVSGAFIRDLAELVAENRLGPAGVTGPGIDPIAEVDENDDQSDASGQGPGFEPSLGGGRHLMRVFFPHLRRIGLHGSLIPSPLLTAFVLSFPHLTHLDLGGTFAGPALLHGLAIAGQAAVKPMRLKSLNLAKLRLPNGGALVGLLAGDHAPFTTSADSTADGEAGAWGSGAVVEDLADLNLFGDRAQGSPLSLAELRLILLKCPALQSGQLRTLDLGSTPMTDVILEEDFPAQPRLLELGLAYCRNITLGAVAELLVMKANKVEVVDLSFSCPAPPGQAGLISANRRRQTLMGAEGMSIMGLHQTLLSRCSSLNPLPDDKALAAAALARLPTNLRVVELDEKTLEAVQGGAGDWKPIAGKGRRSWYARISTTTRPIKPELGELGERVLKHLPTNDPRRLAFKRMYDAPKMVTHETGWRSRKMEILRGDGQIGGREQGLYAFAAFG